MKFRTPISQVRGQGSAKEGTHHFWVQRVTAVALLPLCTLFLCALMFHMTMGRAYVLAWISQPLVSVLFVLTLGTGLYHLKLGLQVVIEDYVNSEGLKLAGLLLNTFFCYAVAAASIFAVLKIAFTNPVTGG